jgi:formylglycine-generating enzyme required for sulfatase activity
MARVGPSDVCIDRYEASANGSTAQSAAGVAPWVSQHQKQAETRCGKAGKRLCTAAEWQAACGGAAGQAYPYGAAFVAGRCNDTNGGQCLQDGSGVLPTGTRSGCVGAAGLYDLSGNVWEWLADTSGGACVAAGGSVDACGDAALLDCTARATFDCNLKSSALGFRCCLTQAW